jgi:8-oxo-dGTP diphosphatase
MRHTVSRMLPKVAAGAIVLAAKNSDSFDHVLLIQRGKIHSRGTWSLPGGHVEYGERLENAVKREVFEETGIAIDLRGFVDVVELIHTYDHYIVHDYWAVAHNSMQEPVAGDDALQARWVHLRDLANYGLSELVTQVIEKTLVFAGVKKEAF